MPRTSYCMCTTACTPTYVSIRQHASCRERRTACAPQPVRQHSSAYASIRQHTSLWSPAAQWAQLLCVHHLVHIIDPQHQHTSAYVTAYVSIRQHTSQHTLAYVSIRHLVHIIDPQHQHTSAYVTAYVSMCQHTSPGSYYRPAASAYVSIRHSIRQHVSAYVTWFILSTRSTLLSFLEGESIESCEFTYRRLLLSVLVLLYASTFALVSK
jgi:hypothetical protein